MKLIFAMFFRLVLPLVIRQTINIIHAGSTFAETTDLSTFGFLYGTFPAGNNMHFSIENIDIHPAKMSYNNKWHSYYKSEIPFIDDNDIDRKHVCYSLVCYSTYISFVNLIMKLFSIWLVIMEKLFSTRNA